MLNRMPQEKKPLLYCTVARKKGLGKKGYGTIHHLILGGTQLGEVLKLGVISQPTIIP